MKRNRLIVLAALCLVPCFAGRAQNSLTGAQAGETQIAFERVRHLQRGINLSMWYAQSGNYSAARLESYTTPADFRLIHDLGFDHVRISINPEPLIAESASATLRPDAMARLDRSVQQITSLGVAVVLDIHPDETWKNDADLTDAGAKKLMNFWHNFAAHFSSTNPDLVFFEILNEPSADVYRWAGLQSRLVAVIRAAAPEHTIIATGGDWGGLNDLLLTEPVRDPNVIYSFHDYEPFTFTHQGASWMGPTVAISTGVPYPSSPEAIAPLLARTSDESARIALEQYGAERWGSARMAGRIALVADWARRRGVPVWCGEFGVYRSYADPAARERWIQDMRQTLERYGIGWDMWDYQDNFGLVTKRGSKPVPDPAILRALGLNATK